MGNLPNIEHLREGHQFTLLLLVQVAQLVSTVLLWRSSPHQKQAPKDAPPIP